MAELARATGIALAPVSAAHRRRGRGPSAGGARGGSRARTRRPRRRRRARARRAAAVLAAAERLEGRRAGARARRRGRRRAPPRPTSSEEPLESVRRRRRRRRRRGGVGAAEPHAVELARTAFKIDAQSQLRRRAAPRASGTTARAPSSVPTSSICHRGTVEVVAAPLASKLHARGTLVRDHELQVVRGRRRLGRPGLPASSRVSLSLDLLGPRTARGHVARRRFSRRLHALASRPPRSAAGTGSRRPPRPARGRAGRRSRRWPRSPARAPPARTTDGGFHHQRAVEIPVMIDSDSIGATTSDAGVAADDRGARPAPRRRRHPASQSPWLVALVRRRRACCPQHLDGPALPFLTSASGPGA